MEACAFRPGDLGILQKIELSGSRATDKHETTPERQLGFPAAATDLGKKIVRPIGRRDGEPPRGLENEGATYA
jgi:hypothetical protein